MINNVLIIGAGPAGLTAAYEIVTKTNLKPIILEESDDIGGISKTIEYKGNRMDIGGHRFFSKSDVVMKWWNNILPAEKSNSNLSSIIDPDKTDKVMLVRSRLSRIYYLKRFFSYPVTLSLSTLYSLGFIRTVKIGFSYIYSMIFPIKEEKSLEDFFINRFGRELYKTFFKDYTEKVWGVSCRKISSEWGAQRVKGLSVWKTILHALTSWKKTGDIDQKDTETSLIETFLYPKFGPGQMWEEVANIIEAKGGEIRKGSKVTGITLEEGKVVSCTVTNSHNAESYTIEAGNFISTMPVKDLISAMSGVPKPVRDIASGLVYRDFITVGLLLSELKIKNRTKIKTWNSLVPDNWIYIQEKEVRIGRLQIFNNWSPYMVKDKNTAWLGLEYFCNEGDDLWCMDNQSFIRFAIDELDKIGIIEKNKVIDGTMIRMPKTYPAYFGTYDHFHEIRKFTDAIPNLFLIGRNGMHKYNNQDHSMLTAMAAVENIISGRTDKDNLWKVNTEQEYHEEKS